MNGAMKSFAAAVADRTGVLDSYALLRRKLTGLQVVILVYHRVGPRLDDWSLEPLPPGIFEEQMKHFRRDYEILPLERLVSDIREARTLPVKAAVITFDDGYRDNYLYAYPVLKEYGIPATIFLTSGHVGSGSLLWPDKVRFAIYHTTLNELDLAGLGRHRLECAHDRARASLLTVEKLKRIPDDSRIEAIEQLVAESGVEVPPDLGRKLMLSWEEAIEMSDNGIDFGAHSVSHPVLTMLPLEQAKEEIALSKREIEAKLGKPVTAFAYPNGDYNANLADCVRDSGFSCAVSVLPFKLIGAGDDLYGFSRIPAMKDRHKMTVMTSGLWGDVQGILRRRRT